MTKWALVTGASAGIGKEFCEQLAARGDNVVLVARRADRLEELKAHLEKRYRVHAEVLAADLANADDLKRVAERVAQASDPIEVLVNNAGFGLKTAFLDTDVEKEIASVDVMVKAVVVLSHAAGRAMRERGRGAITNVSSVAGFMASGTYSAAKSYVTVFSESLAGQLAGTGVTVTALCPGFTHTDFHASADIDVDKTSASDSGSTPTASCATASPTSTPGASSRCRGSSTRSRRSCCATCRAPSCARAP